MGAVNKEALRKAGRITLGDAAEELGEKTGWGKDRWWGVLYGWVSPMHQHTLMRRSPGNLQDLLPYDPPKVPEYDDHVFIAEVNKLLDEHPEWGNARLEDGKATRSKIEQVKADDWRNDARIIADELFDRDTNGQVRDSLEGYSRRVRDEMQAREIHGPRGRIVNPNTIMREALQGTKWWANKKK